MHNLLFVAQFCGPKKKLLYTDVCTSLKDFLRQPLPLIIPLLRHFIILGQKNAQNMPRYYTEEQAKMPTESEVTKWLNQTFNF